jgi:hypothetical protein
MAGAVSSAVERPAVEAGAWRHHLAMPAALDYIVSTIVKTEGMEMAKAKPERELKTALLVLRIKPSARAMAEVVAERQGRSLSNYVERLIVADSERSKSS